MPLDVATLQSDIAAICANPPADAAGCGQAWAAAVGKYASGVVPSSTTVSAAQSALAGALTAAFVPNGGAAPLMETAFAAFAVTVAGGMAPLFTGVPPAAPVGFAAQFAGPMPETPADAGSQIGSLIDKWMKTGKAALVAPPNTVTPWS